MRRCLGDNGASQSSELVLEQERKTLFTRLAALPDQPLALGNLALQLISRTPLHNQLHSLRKQNQ